MNQIRTYSKYRPKSFISSKDEDSIFQRSHDSIKSINIDESDEDLYINFQKKKKNSLFGGRKMRPVKDNKSCQKKLKSLNKIGHHKSTPLKRKPTDTTNSHQKRTTRHSKAKKQKQQSDSNVQHSQGKSKIFSWSGSSKDCSEHSIEILRKDEGMTWQQKISFLLPKMHQEYTNENSINGKTIKGKVSTPLLDISAEEVCEPVTDEDDDEDYTYTWVTESATNSKSNVGQSSRPSTKIVSGLSQPTHTVDNYDIAVSGFSRPTHIMDNSKTAVSWFSQHTADNTRTAAIGLSQSSTTLVAADNSKKSSQKKLSDSTVGRTGKLKLSVGKGKTIKPTAVPKPSPNEFLDKDRQDASVNQKWNSTIHKNAKNIKDYGFPDVSSIRMTQNLSKKSSIQQRLETTPNKIKTVKTPSRPRKEKITEKQLQSTKMFLSDHIAFVDMVPEMSTIRKGKSDESIEITRDRSPFIKITKAESPITPYISPKQTDQEQVFTSTPTKDKDHKGKEFPEFDLSSVQIPEFDDDELEIHESREVNSQEIVCEPTDEEFEVVDPVDVEQIPHGGKEVPKECAPNHDEECKNGKKSTKLSQNYTIEPVKEDNIDKLHIDLTPIENVTVIPVNKSPRNSHKSKSKVQNGRNYDVEECCIEAIRVPVKPIRKSNIHIDYQHILKHTPIDCIQQIFEL